METWRQLKVEKKNKLDRERELIQQPQDEKSVTEKVRILIIHSAGFLYGKQYTFVMVEQVCIPVIVPDHDTLMWKYYL